MASPQHPAEPDATLLEETIGELARASALLAQLDASTRANRRLLDEIDGRLERELDRALHTVEAAILELRQDVASAVAQVHHDVGAAVAELRREIAGHLAQQGAGPSEPDQPSPGEHALPSA